MHTKDKVKMCPYCEGTIAIQATECHYCGSSLVKKGSMASAYQTEDSLASLYEPPYAPTKKSPVYSIPRTEAAPKTVRDPLADQDDELEEYRSISRPKKILKRGVKPQTREGTSDADEEEETTQIGALLLLSLGGHLFTLAWLLFFLSDHGKLVLEWKSRYWFIYFLVSLPLLYKGWKKLSR